MGRCDGREGVVCEQILVIWLVWKAIVSGETTKKSRDFPEVGRDLSAEAHKQSRPFSRTVDKI